MADQAGVLAKAKEALQETITITNEDRQASDSWETQYNKNGIWISKKAVAGSSWCFWAIESAFDVSMKCLFHVVDDISVRTQWDDIVLKYERVQNIDDNVDVVYSATSSLVGGLIGARDYLDIKMSQYGDDESYAGATSIELVQFPTKQDFIRGHNYLSAYKLTKISEKSTKLLYVIRSDLKGQMPAWLVNKGMSGALQKVFSNIHKFVKAQPHKS